MPFVNIYLKQNNTNNLLKIREIIQKVVAEAASGRERGVVNEAEVEVFFEHEKEGDYLIKSLVIHVSFKKTPERLENFEKRHENLFEAIKNALPEYSNDFSLQTTLSEHEYSEA